MKIWQEVLAFKTVFPESKNVFCTYEIYSNVSYLNILIRMCIKCTNLLLYVIFGKTYFHVSYLNKTTLPCNIWTNLLSFVIFEKDLLLCVIFEQTYSQVSYFNKNTHPCYIWTNLLLGVIFGQTNMCHKLIKPLFCVRFKQTRSISMVSKPFVFWVFVVK